MQWLAFPFADAPVTPLDSAASSITGYILSYGLPGILVLTLAWLLFKGWRLVPSGYEAKIRAVARDEARADLTAERDRVIAEKAQAEEQRDEAQAIARDKLVPVLISFTATTQALLPLLQNLAGRQGGPGP